MFSSLTGYKRTVVDEGTRLKLTYQSAKRPTESEIRATVEEISDHKMHLLLWLDVDYRDPTYTLSLFSDDSNLHYIHGGSGIRTVNEKRTSVTAEVIDDWSDQ